MLVRSMRGFGAGPLLLASALAVTLAAGGGRLGAEPLAAEACERLRQEQAELVKAGVQDNMSKGPAWAKANLAAARLGEIERFIDVEAALLFRCARPLPPEVAKAVEAEAAPPPPPPPPKLKQKSPGPRPAAKSATGAAAAGESEGDATATPVAPATKPRVRRPPRPKAAPVEPQPQQDAAPK